MPSLVAAADAGDDDGDAAATTADVDAEGDGADLSERRRKKKEAGFQRRSLRGIGHPKRLGRLTGTLRSKYRKMYHHHIRFK